WVPDRARYRSLVRDDEDEALPHLRVPAACFARVMRRSPSNWRGRRECRVLQPHPQPCVRSEEAHKQSHHRSSRLTDIPCATVYGLLRAPPGVRDLIVTVMRGSRRVGPEGPTSPTRALSTSPGVPGPHGFAVRVSVARLATPPTSIASRLTFRDDAHTPLLPRRDARLIARFPIFGNRYFRARTGRPDQIERAHEIRVSAHAILSVEARQRDATLGKLIKLIRPLKSFSSRERLRPVGSVAHREQIGASGKSRIVGWAKARQRRAHHLL